MGCHFLLQGNFPTQGSNLGLLHWRQALYPLSHWGSCKSTVLQFSKRMLCEKKLFVVLEQKQKCRSMDQDRSSEINTHTYDYLIYDKRSKNIWWRKDSLFNKWCWQNWTTTCKRMKLEHFLTPYPKINSKLIKDLNIRPETIKLLEEKWTFLNINHSKIFFDPAPRVMKIKTKIHKQGTIKLTRFCTAKETINKTVFRMGDTLCKECDWQRINLQNIQTAHAAQHKKQTTQSKNGQTI